MLTPRLLSATVLFFHLASSIPVEDPAPTPAEILFRQFKIRFQKQYASPEEEESRFAIFEQTLKKVVSQSAKPEELQRTLLSLRSTPAASNDIVSTHLTPFADWTDAEFMERRTSRISGSIVPKTRPAKNSKTDEQFLEDTSAPLDIGVEELPQEWDWTEKGAVSGVKNQGDCGSCWAFGAVGNVEGRNYLKNGTLEQFSEQELVDCTPGGSIGPVPWGANGCAGAVSVGAIGVAFNYLIESKRGLEPESAYPYLGKDGGQCKVEQNAESVFVEDWKWISGHVTSEDTIAAALVKYGPLIIGVSVGSDWKDYSGGILNPWFSYFWPHNHIVTLVGFGEEGGKKFWKIKNSWSADWGERGYIRLARGNFWPTSGMNTEVATAIVA